MTELVIHVESFWIGFVIGFVTLMFFLSIFANID